MAQERPVRPLPVKELAAGRGPARGAGGSSSSRSCGRPSWRRAAARCRAVRALVECGRARMPRACRLFVKASAEVDEQDGPVRDQLVRDHVGLRLVRPDVRRRHHRGRYRDTPIPCSSPPTSTHHARFLPRPPPARRRAGRGQGPLAFEAPLADARVPAAAAVISTP